MAELMPSQKCSLFKHGLCYTKEWKIWIDMRRRCNDTKHHAYSRYGGRGIKVCDAWQNSFATFYADMGPRPTPEHSLDREDNNGGYSPSNCRWATHIEQANNKRNNVILEHDGQRLSMYAWARITGLTPQTIWKRIKRGWNVHETLTRRPREVRHPNIRRTDASH